MRVEELERSSTRERESFKIATCLFFSNKLSRRRRPKRKTRKTQLSSLSLSPPLSFPLPQGTVGHPRKRFYRARAHANPLSDGFYADLPDSPRDVAWEDLYKEAFAVARSRGEAAPRVTVADVGCGFGGLLTRLSPLTPRGELLVGLELRSKVCDYVRQRAAVARARALAEEEERGAGGEEAEATKAEATKAEATTTTTTAKDPPPPPPSTTTPSPSPSCLNVSALRINAQRHLVNLFEKHQLNKIFFLFPDPHFKAKNWRRRIVTPSSAAEFAYVLRPGGRLYTITDVEDLGGWMAGVLDDCAMFRRLSDDELAGDAAAGLLSVATEEGQKVARNGGRTFRACYERLERARRLPE